MKNKIAILGLSALAAASIQTASAGDREWATVGKVLTGVAAVHVLSHVLPPAPVYATVYATPAPVYVAPAPVYVVPPPPVCVAPAPVVVYPQPVCVAPRPIYVAPRPFAPAVVSVNVGFGDHHHNRGGHHRW